MKKVLLGIALISPLVFIISFAMLFFTMASPASASIQPMPLPCTEAKLREYKMICFDLGVPYDVALMADFFHTQKYSESGFLSNIEDVTVLFSALEFCYINESVYKYVVIGYRKGDPIYGWVLSGRNRYSGTSSILQYIKKSRKDTGLIATDVITAVPTAASAKSGDNTRYEASFATTPITEYLPVVRAFWPKVTDEELQIIDQLHKERYLPQLYGEAAIFDPALANIQLPEVVVGDVTRMQLLKVGSSIIGWPYEWGGKSAATGRPGGALDCSGYVDWVYYQCFGTTVGAGTAGQFYRSQEISESELQIGDLGFYYRPEDVGPGNQYEYNHVGIYVGSIDGKPAFIHCGGSTFGTPSSPTGRVGISINRSGVANNVNPAGGSFSPPMPATSFRYFRRPQFQFSGE